MKDTELVPTGKRKGKGETQGRNEAVGGMPFPIPQSSGSPPPIYIYKDIRSSNIRISTEGNLTQINLMGSVASLRSSEIIFKQHFLDSIYWMR